MLNLPMIDNITAITDATPRTRRTSIESASITGWSQPMRCLTLRNSTNTNPDR